MPAPHPPHPPHAATIFGIRILFDESLDRFEDLEWGAHPWLKRAKDADLEYWWGKVADTETESHALFIGDILATVGPPPQHAPSFAFSPDQLVTRCQAAADKLTAAGLITEFGNPALWVQWIDDFEP